MFRVAVPAAAIQRTVVFATRAAGRAADLARRGADDAASGGDRVQLAVVVDDQGADQPATPPVVLNGQHSLAAATLHRVRRLKESGVIRIISAQLDAAACGFPLQVYVAATLARGDMRSSQAFDDLIRSLPQIIAADSVAGETDYLLTVVARDVAELQQVLVSLALRGGSRLVTYLRLAEIKPPSRLPLGPP